jgi:hypothetical protein
VQESLGCSCSPARSRDAGGGSPVLALKRWQSKRTRKLTQGLTNHGQQQESEAAQQQLTTMDSSKNLKPRSSS